MNVQAATGSSEAIEDAFAAGREAAAQALEGVTLGARSVALLLASIELDLAEVLRGVRSVLDVPVVGCTTYSEATDRGYFDDSVSLLLLTGDDLRFGVGLGEGVSADPEGAVARAWAEARAMLDGEPAVAIALPDAALNYRGEVVTAALVRAAAGRCPVVGGCPGDGGRFRQTFQLFGDRVLTDALPVLLLGGGLTAHVVTRTGWTPMGEPGVATHAEANRLFRVDGQPSIAFLRRYIGDLDAHPEVMGTYPIALMDETVERQGVTHYVIRSPFFYDAASDSVAYGGVIPAGARVQMGRSSPALILAGAADAADRLRHRVAGRDVLCAFFASCGARKLMLGLSTAQEAATVRDALPGVPLAGFYSFGEIGAFDSDDAALATARYHNCTLVLCAICLPT
jgi:hypothetical protein